ncbi:unnamed protein product [Linum trigynum]|uniref:Uncharacterized protein n=1 Tax=Linum trigynum TaxID=586398 RepID=A0AAV2DKL0_9ROSI
METQYTTAKHTTVGTWPSSWLMFSRSSGISRCKLVSERSTSQTLFKEATVGRMTLLNKFTLQIEILQALAIPNATWNYPSQLLRFSNFSK